MKRTPAVLIAAAGLVVGGTVAATASSSDDAKYAGCVTKTTGTLRMIYPSSGCTSKEYKITWNEKGPQGLRGLKGDPGKNGTNGRNGTNGTNGKDGKDGAASVVNGDKIESDVDEDITYDFGARCPTGTVPIGRSIDSTGPLSITFDKVGVIEGTSIPSWNLEFTRATSDNIHVSLTSICLGTPVD